MTWQINNTQIRISILVSNYPTFWSGTDSVSGNIFNVYFKLIRSLNMVRGERQP